MFARCARCQGTFTTDRYGRQRCPLCGSELILADPSGNPPPSSPPPESPPPESGSGWSPPPPGGASAGSPPPVFPPPPPAGSGWAPPPPPPPPPQGSIPSPLADRAGRSVLGAFFQTWKLAALEPQRFFGSVRTDQVRVAVLFALLVGSIGWSFAALYDLLGGPHFLAMMRGYPQLQPEQLRFFELVMSTHFTVGRIVLGPVIVLVLLLVGAGIIHGGLAALGSTGGGFNATLTVVAYSFAPWLLGAIPTCGALAMGVWQVVVLILGLAAAHRAEPWRPAVVVLVTALLGCCCCCFGGMAGVGMALGLHGAPMPAGPTAL